VEVRVLSWAPSAKFDFDFSSLVGEHAALECPAGEGRVGQIRVATVVMAVVMVLQASAVDAEFPVQKLPDGKALRIALGQKVKVHAIPFNNSFVLDLLPESWADPMPGLTE
jgi:hypothetical protein